jgi:hypothetical protein
VTTLLVCVAALFLWLFLASPAFGGPPPPVPLSQMPWWLYVRLLGTREQRRRLDAIVRARAVAVHPAPLGRPLPPPASGADALAAARDRVASRGLLEPAPDTVHLEWPVSRRLRRAWRMAGYAVSPAKPYGHPSGVPCQPCAARLRAARDAVSVPPDAPGALPGFSLRLDVRFPAGTPSASVAEAAARAEGLAQMLRTRLPGGL